MLCQKCKERESNVKYTQVINGEKTEMMLCEKCASELGIGEMKFNMPLSFSNIFGDFLEPELDFLPKLKMETILKCDYCGMTYDEFMNAGKFGCSNCYNTFADKIEVMLKRLHGSTEYLGKRKEMESTKKKMEIEGTKEEKKNLTKEEKIVMLKEKLKECIKEEKYEEAAKIRDEIKKHEGSEQ